MRATDILNQILMGWPSSSKEITSWFDSLATSYDETIDNIEIGSEAYPKPGPTRFNPKKDKVEWYNLSTDQWQLPWKFIGHRYSIKFKESGRELAVIVDQEGNVLRREYADLGNFHQNEVFDFLRGWTKVVKQTQHGGRPAGMQDKTMANYRELVERFHNSLLSQREFCREAGISRSTLQRAVKFVSENGLTGD